MKLALIFNTSVLIRCLYFSFNQLYIAIVFTCSLPSHSCNQYLYHAIVLQQCFAVDFQTQNFLYFEFKIMAYIYNSKMNSVIHNLISIYIQRSDSISAHQSLLVPGMPISMISVLPGIMVISTIQPIVSNEGVLWYIKTLLQDDHQTHRMLAIVKILYIYKIGILCSVYIS